MGSLRGLKYYNLEYDWYVLVNLELPEDEIFKQKEISVGELYMFSGEPRLSGNQFKDTIRQNNFGSPTHTNLCDESEKTA